MDEQVKKPGTAGSFAQIQPNVHVSNPNNVSAIYANHFGAGGTLTDFSLYFLEVGQLPGEKGTIAKQELKAAVTLPLALAEPLIQILKQIVEGHKSAIKQATEAAKSSVKQ
jgi:hypothetical protein